MTDQAYFLALLVYFIGYLVQRFSPAVGNAIRLIGAAGFVFLWLVHLVITKTV